MSHSDSYQDTGPTTAYYQGVEFGEQRERERIVKLLEDRLKGCSGYGCETCDEQSGLIVAKALIKGEQK